MKIDQIDPNKLFLNYGILRMSERDKYLFWSRTFHIWLFDMKIDRIDPNELSLNYGILGMNEIPINTDFDPGLSLFDDLIKIDPNELFFRAMEKENKKFRDVGKKEYSELVRSLVAFVRKRDPRVKAFNQKLEAKREENARKTAENRKKQLAEQARLKAEAAEAYKKSTFGMKSMEDELERLEDALDAEEEDNLFCVACDKEMRNEKAFATHRSSKKHLENVERLKEMLQDEDLMSSSDEVPSSDHEPEPPTPEAESDRQHSEAEETPSPNKSDKKSKASKKKQKNNNKDLQNSDNDEDRTAVKSVNDVPTGAKGNKKKRRKAKGSTKHCEDGSADAAAELIDPLSCQVCKTKFQSKNKLFSHLKESKHAVRI